MPGAESGPVISTTQCSRGSNLISAQPSGGCSSQSWSSLCSHRCGYVPKEPFLRAPVQRGVKAGRGAALWLEQHPVSLTARSATWPEMPQELELVRTHPSSGLAPHRVSKSKLQHFQDNSVPRLSHATMLLVMHAQVQQLDVEVAVQQE